MKKLSRRLKRFLNNDNLYDALRDARAEIDDAVNGGKDLAETGKMFGIEPVRISGISETAPVENAPAQLKSLTTSLDFNELVFSYGLNEISSAEEFDDGIAAIRVTAVKDAHLPEIDEVKDKITAMWEVQEKDALAKETADNIIADAENGEQLADAAKARNLEVFRSEPINRNETFAGLSAQEINDLFVTEDGAVKLYEHPGNNFVIVTPYETVNYADELDKDALAEVKTRAAVSMGSDMAQSALNAYAEGMDS